GLEHRKLRQWDQAAADFRKAADLGARAYVWGWHAEALLNAGDDEGYRRACAGMLERFGESSDPSEAHAAARACLLGPRPGVELARVVPLAERALADGGVHDDKAEYLETLALARYRAGRFEEALRLLDEPEARYRQNRDVLAAMALRRLGRTDEAWQ